MNILITGAAGYIGSHTTKAFLEHTNYNIFAIDNLSTGYMRNINALQEIRAFNFTKLDLAQTKELKELIKTFKIDTIIHFAAFIAVEESVKNPISYYQNNLQNTISLIQIAIDLGVKNFIFSSTAAVYGEPNSQDSVTETQTPQPINPYGHAKLMVEQILQDCFKAYNFYPCILRYFNVAGADVFYKNDKLSPRFGQISKKSTHLIKIALECATGKKDKMSIYGDDYPTKDGTCIRDYIHVDDLASAHLSALDYITKHKKFEIFNVGYNKGYSVREVINMVKKISKRDFAVQIAPRREGDSSYLVASTQKILSLTNFKPKYNSLELICSSAFEWEKSLKDNK